MLILLFTVSALSIFGNEKVNKVEYTQINKLKAMQKRILVDY